MKPRIIRRPRSSVIVTAEKSPYAKMIDVEVHIKMILKGKPFEAWVMTSSECEASATAEALKMAIDQIAHMKAEAEKCKTSI